jgi:hypothetical protein
MTDPEASPTAGKAPAHPVIEAHDEHGAARSHEPGTHERRSHQREPEQPADGTTDRPAGAADEDPDTPVDR